MKDLIGEELLKTIQDTLKNLKEGPEKLAVQILFESVQAHGLQGLSELKKTLSKKEMTLSGLSPRLASDLVAYLQNEEANRREKLQETIAQLEELAIQVGLTILKSLLVAV